MDFADMVQVGDLKGVSKCFHCPGHGKTEGDGAGGQEKTDVNFVMVHGGQHFAGAEDIVKYKTEDKRHSAPKPTSYAKVEEARTVDEKLFLYLSPEEVPLLLYPALLSLICYKHVGGQDPKEGW